jgi:ADP-heptose:LPS heptosyltransferase
MADTVPPTAAPSFLVIRRDNIGDLVCTTPLIAALRQRHPRSWIGALVNRYAAPVLENNPDLSAVLCYDKAKHRSRGDSLIRLYWERLQLVRSLRKRRIDYVLLAAPVRQESAERMARLIKPRHIVGFAGQGRLVDLAARAPEVVVHQVERTYSLLRALDIDGGPPPLKVAAAPSLERAARARLPAWLKPVVGIHISAREADRRWPDDRYEALIRRLLERGACVVLTWAPGDRANPRFPGDDARAARLGERAAHAGLIALPTAGLAELIAALAACDYVVSSDGGPVHLAAALGKPVLCLFGHEDARLWHPWGVPYELLQRPSRRAEDITVDEAWAAWERLVAKAPAPQPSGSASTSP